MKKLLFVLALLGASAPVWAQLNRGELKSDRWVTFDKNQYCIRRNVSTAENSLYHNYLEGIRNDSCINITIPPMTNTRDNELWQNMGLEISLPLSVTDAIDVFGSGCFIFLVDSTGYIMLRYAKAADDSDTLLGDSIALFDVNQFNFSFDRWPNAPVDVELELFRHRVGYYNPTYFAKVGCVRFVFFNIPFDDVVKTLKSVKILSCYGRIR